MSAAARSSRTRRLRPHSEPCSPRAISEIIDPSPAQLSAGRVREPSWVRARSTAGPARARFPLCITRAMEAPGQGAADRSSPFSAMSDRYDTLVVGAGYAGTIMAERLASQRGQRVLVIDRRDHIAGNAFDYHDEHGVLVHKYGPHIFHTNSEKAVEYLSNFTEWRPYEHRVLARVDGKFVPMPINRTTINELYGLGLSTDEDVERFLEERAEPVDYIRTSEDVVVAKVGRELYEKFFRGYTRKQWQRDPSELHSSVCARIPIRTNEDDRYFTDAFQAMPTEGYTAMFERILDHELIEVALETHYEDVIDEVE